MLVHLIIDSLIILSCLAILGNCFKVSLESFFTWPWVLALIPPCVTVVVYYWDALGAKYQFSLISNTLKPWKYWTTEYWWWNIARQIRHMYNKERNCAPFFQKLTYKYIILNWYFKIQECWMFPLMFRFYF